jgi:hypothetical protein
VAAEEEVADEAAAESFVAEEVALDGAGAEVEADVEIGEVPAEAEEAEES